MRPDHPTKVALLNTAIELIDAHGVNGFTVENLLEKAGISKGSLYHHYSDFNSLIEAAQIARFGKYVDQDVDALMAVLTNSSSREDMLNRLSIVAKSVHQKARREQRADRVSILGLAAHSEEFSRRLGAEQQRLTDALTDLVREGQSRGFIRDDIDGRALATFIQAYSIGKVLDDIVPDSLAEDVWDEMIRRVFTNLL